MSKTELQTYDVGSLVGISRRANESGWWRSVLLCGESVHIYKYWGDESVPIHARHRFLDTRRMKVTKETGAEDLDKILTEYRRSKKNRAVISTELFVGRSGYVLLTKGKYHFVMWNMTPAILGTWIPRELLKHKKLPNKDQRELVSLIESVEFEVADYDEAVAMFEKMNNLLNHQ